MHARAIFLIVLGIGLCALAIPGAAGAHAMLVESAPPDQARLDSPPAELVLRFNETVRVVAARLLDPRGEDLLDPAEVMTAGDTLRAVLPRSLPPGAYVFSYRVISADSHPVAGSLVFSVGVALTPGGKAASDSTRDAPWWQRAGIANRALYLGSLAAALGGTLFLLVIGFEDVAVPAWLRAVFGTGCVLCALTLALSIALEGAGIVDAPVERLLKPEIWSLGLDTTRGSAAVVALLGLGMTTLFHRLGRTQPTARLALWLGAALVLASFVLSGHAATAAPRWLARPLWLVHVAVALFWIGSLLPLYLCSRAGGRSRAVRRFSAVAVIAVPAMLAAGAAMAALQMQAWAALFGSSYGLWLAAKLVLVGILLALAVYNRARLVLHLEMDESARRRFASTVRVELLIGLAVLCAAAGLSHQVPPRASTQDETARKARALVASGDWTAEITVEPAKAGRNDISVKFSGRERQSGQSVGPMEVNVELSSPAMGIEPFSRRMQRQAPGIYRAAETGIPFPGRWEIHVDALISDFDKLSFATEVVVR